MNRKWAAVVTLSAAIPQAYREAIAAADIGAVVERLHSEHPGQIVWPSLVMLCRECVEVPDVLDDGTPTVRHVPLDVATTKEMLGRRVVVARATVEVCFPPIAMDLREATAEDALTLWRET
jgi:hypothetical protein